MVGFTNQLHVTVFNSIVNHFHIVASTARTNPFTTWNVFVWSHLRGNRFEYWLDSRPGIHTSTRHHTRAFQCTFFPTRNSSAYKLQAFFFNIFCPAFSITVMSVTTINNDVTFIQQRNQVINNGIHGRAGFDKHHDFTRACQIGNKIFQRVAPDKVFSGSTTADQVINLLRRAVIDCHFVAATFDVKGKVFAHHGQTDQAKICEFFRHILLTFQLST